MELRARFESQRSGMNKELLNSAIAALSIQDVVLSGSKTIIAEDFDPLFPARTQLLVQFRHHLVDQQTKDVLQDGHAETKRILRARLECAFRVIAPKEPSAVDEREVVSDQEVDVNSEDPGEMVVEATATFAAYYLIHSQVADEALNEFCLHNVAYHIWPYWREYSASMTARIQIPSFVIPFYRVPTE